MSEAVKDLGPELDPRVFDSAEFQKDPFPVYRQLREYHPIFHDRFHNRWIVSRYWDMLIQLFIKTHSPVISNVRSWVSHPFGTLDPSGCNANWFAIPSG